jgi:hypothetical protein
VLEGRLKAGDTVLVDADHGEIVLEPLHEPVEDEPVRV